MTILQAYLLLLARKYPGLVPARASGAPAEFLELVGPDGARAAYHHAARKMHPDHGGDADQMRNLNATFAEVREAVYGAA
jgi:hypothetical protein